MRRLTLLHEEEVALSGVHLVHVAGVHRLLQGEECVSSSAGVSGERGGTYAFKGPLQQGLTLLN